MSGRDGEPADGRENVHGERRRGRRLTAQAVVPSAVAAEACSPCDSSRAPSRAFRASPSVAAGPSNLSGRSFAEWSADMLAVGGALAAIKLDIDRGFVRQEQLAGQLAARAAVYVPGLVAVDEQQLLWLRIAHLEMEDARLRSVALFGAATAGSPVFPDIPGGAIVNKKAPAPAGVAAVGASSLGAWPRGLSVAAVGDGDFGTGVLAPRAVVASAGAVAACASGLNAAVMDGDFGTGVLAPRTVVASTGAVAACASGLNAAVVDGDFGTGALAPCAVVASTGAVAACAGGVSATVIGGDFGTGVLAPRVSCRARRRAWWRARCARRRKFARKRAMLRTGSRPTPGAASVEVVAPMRGACGGDATVGDSVTSSSAGSAGLTGAVVKERVSVPLVVATGGVLSSGAQARSSCMHAAVVDGDFGTGVLAPRAVVAGTGAVATCASGLSAAVVDGDFGVGVMAPRAVVASTAAVAACTGGVSATVVASTGAVAACSSGLNAAVVDGGLGMCRPASCSCRVRREAWWRARCACRLRHFSRN